MRKPLWIAITFGLFAALAATPQPPGDFEETAPPKIPVPASTLPDDAARSSAPRDVGPEGGVDPLMREIGAYMDEASATPPSGAATAPESAGGAPFSPLRSALNAVMALCIVLLLFFVLVYAIKRVGKRSPLLAGQQLGKVLGRVGLSPQASLHFVEISGEVLVIGVTQHTVTLLRTFDQAEFATGDAATTPPAETAAAVSAARFLDQLKEVQGTMTGMGSSGMGSSGMGSPGMGSSGMDEELDSLKGDLQRLKQYFQDSARGSE